ncbi:hypothetical protein [Streptococcus oriscaviae]|uniref:Uncharacterized protein n=1 Tax=Streptococcus oriscaviae TaxID=2781599 RepID=A0ABX7YNP7_9STRE|nr:hypothetical protein [Streptococcus oriscaviae]QUE55083.1 hypothetical protein INT76_04165 [Streptococcus oriscaviae]
MHNRTLIVSSSNTIGLPIGKPHISPFHKQLPPVHNHHRLPEDWLLITSSDWGYYTPIQNPCQEFI